MTFKTLVCFVVFGILLFGVVDVAIGQGVLNILRLSGLYRGCLGERVRTANRHQGECHVCWNGGRDVH